MAYEPTKFCASVFFEPDTTKAQHYFEVSNIHLAFHGMHYTADSVLTELGQWLGINYSDRKISQIIVNTLRRT